MSPRRDNLKDGWLETYLQGRLTGPILIAVIAVAAALAVPLVWLVRSFGPARVIVLGLAAVGVGWLLARRGVRAVARQTFSQCIRMRIAVAFMALLVLVLVLLPSLMKGDGTLAGSIRTYLSYGVGLTAGLLSIVAVLLAVAVVSWDIRERTVFLVTVKPIRRWEYLIGRWLGVMALNGLLLGIAAGGTYIFLQYLRDGQATSDNDRRVVETEVFSARTRIRPETPDIESAVRARLESMQEDEAYAQTIEALMASRNLTREDARERLIRQLIETAKTQSELIRPGMAAGYRFNNVDVAGEALSGQGTVDRIDVSRGLVRVTMPPRVAGMLVYRGPVMVQGYRGRVEIIDGQRVTVSFSAPDMTHVELRSLQSGDDVAVTVEPTVQFQYKVEATAGERSGTLGRRVDFYRLVPQPQPEAETSADDAANAPVDFVPLYSDVGSGPLDTLTTVTLPVFGEAAEGETDLAVAYRNIPSSPDEPARPVRIRYEDVSLLYRVGSFEMNFLRAVLLIGFQLAFLTALGVFFGSFLSFPVAAFACMVLLVNGWMFGWLGEAVAGQSGVVGGMGDVTLAVLGFVLPDFTEVSPTQSLVDGLAIGWPVVARLGAMTLVVRTGLYLLAGSLIFQSRELAGEQK